MCRSSVAWVLLVCATLSASHAQADVTGAGSVSQRQVVADVDKCLQVAPCQFKRGFQPKVNRVREGDCKWQVECGL